MILLMPTDTDRCRDGRRHERRPEADDGGVRLDLRACKPVGVITVLLRLPRRRSWVGSRNSGYGRHP